MELVNRFVFDAYGLTPINGASLDGANYASALSSHYPSVPLVENGTPNQPYLAGDVVSFAGSGALAEGHVAVVTSSTYASGDGGDYAVTLLQENAPSGDVATASVTNWAMADPSGSQVRAENFDALGAGTPPAAPVPAFAEDSFRGDFAGNGRSDLAIVGRVPTSGVSTPSIFPSPSSA